MNLKMGIVSQLDAAKARARVRFPEEDNDSSQEQPGLESYWLQVVSQWTLQTKAFSMPALGAQVACLMDEHLEFGVILGGVYSAADPRPAAPDGSVHLEFADGTVLEYDPAAHALKADVKGTAILEATGQATLKGAAILLDGPVHVTQTLQVDQGSTLTGAVAAGSTVTAVGNINTTTGVVQKAGVPYNFP